MTDPYVSYDTFSLGNDPDGSPEAAGVGPAPSADKKLPPILARLPRLEPASPKPKTRQRIDAAESPLARIHIDETVSFADAGPTPLVSDDPEPSAGFDPVATIRIDTVTPTSVDTPDKRGSPRQQRDEPTPATLPFRPVGPATETATTPGASTDGEPWTTTLLEIESTIQPYARWIALAALIAAMGLTAVILQGAGATLDPGTTTPPDLSEPTGSVIAESEPVEPAVGAGLSWPSVEPIDASPNADLRPLNEPGVAIAQTPAPALAVGPASASRVPGHARLTGEVLAPSQERIDVADATHRAAYPETRR